METAPYATLWQHRYMLHDRVRNEVFRRAIFAAVKPGHVVMDMGAGSGILSVFAARAGARKVYAIERTTIAEFAQEILEANGVEDRVEIIQSDVESVELPEKVDVITLAGLPRDYALALQLHYFDEVPLKRIAGFLEVPLSTVKWRLYRGRQLMRPLLEKKTRGENHGKGTRALETDQCIEAHGAHGLPVPVERG